MLYDRLGEYWVLVTTPSELGYGEGKGSSMQSYRILFLTASLLLPASSWGQDVYGYQDYTVKICNRGRLAVDVATGFQDSSLLSQWWVIDRWYHVSPGNCNVVSSRHLSIPDGLLGRSRFAEDHLHLAFAFTDSTGVWGAGIVNPNETNARIGNQYIEKKDLKPSNRRFCIHPGDSKYRVDGQDPSAGCGGAETFLVPASIDYAATPDYVFGALTNESYPTTFDVGFGPQDRAIPMGSGPPRTSKNGETGGGNGDDSSFLALLMKEITKAGSEATKKPLSPAEARTQKAQARAQMLSWVREDVAAYIAASKTGFVAYKKGQAQDQGGLKMWDSNTKPLIAQGCWVVQGGTQATFSCLLYNDLDLDAVNTAYADLTDDISQSLPSDWTSIAGPAFGPEFPNSKGYRSSSGAHGEVWVARTASGGLYQLHFQIVTAPPGTKPNSSTVTSQGTDDDPIGDGGFIKRQR